MTEDELDTLLYLTHDGGVTVLNLLTPLEKAELDKWVEAHSFAFTSKLEDVKFFEGKRTKYLEIINRRTEDGT